MSARIRCRVVACRERGAAGEWVFHLVNDGEVALDTATLERVSTEWGDQSSEERTDVRVRGLAPGATAAIWRSDGEFRTELSLRVQAAGRDVRLAFEFPKLYRQRGLPVLQPLGTPGFEVRAEA